MTRAIIRLEFSYIIQSDIVYTWTGGTKIPVLAVLFLNTNAFKNGQSRN